MRPIDGLLYLIKAALVTGAALGVVVAVADDRLRTAFADAFKREALE